MKKNGIDNSDTGTNLTKGSKNWYNCLTPYAVIWQADGSPQGRLFPKEQMDKPKAPEDRKAPGVYVLPHKLEAYGEAMDMLMRMQGEGDSNTWNVSEDAPADDPFKAAKIDRSLYKK
jgi:hypothetical protein